MTSTERATTAPTRYLRLIGRLTPDNRLLLKPGYLIDRPGSIREEPTSPVTAELLDADGRVLLRHPIPATPYCADGVTLPDLAVRAKIPFPPATRTIRFYRNDVFLLEQRVPDQSPRVELTWKPPHDLKGKVTITWRGEHPGGERIQYFLRYSHDDGRTWQRVGTRTDRTELTIDVDQLPGGERCRIAVVATDGVNTITAVGDPFRVAVKPPAAIVLAPPDGATFATGEPVDLRGQGYYLEEGRAEFDDLTWSSSRDGDLGKGSDLETSGLSDGTHRITLAVGSGDRTGRATVTIRVGRAPAQPPRVG